MEKEQDAEIYYDKDTVEKISKEASSFIINQLKDIMETKTRDVRITLNEAKALYSLGGICKDLALKAFSEDEIALSDLPVTWEEFCEKFPFEKETKFFISELGSIIQIPPHYKNGGRDGEPDKCIFSSRESADAHIAIAQLRQLRDCYRSGWIPNGDTCYGIVMGFSSDGTISPYIKKLGGDSKFLSFKTESVAKFFLHNFRDLIETAGDLI